MNIEIPLTMTPVDNPPPHNKKGGIKGTLSPKSGIPWKAVVASMEPGQWYSFESDLATSASIG